MTATVQGWWDCGSCTLTNKTRSSKSTSTACLFWAWQHNCCMHMTCTWDCCRACNAAAIVMHCSSKQQQQLSRVESLIFNTVFGQPCNVSALGALFIHKHLPDTHTHAHTAAAVAGVLPPGICQHLDRPPCEHLLPHLHDPQGHSSIPEGAGGEGQTAAAAAVTRQPWTMCNLPLNASDYFMPACRCKLIFVCLGTLQWPAQARVQCKESSPSCVLLLMSCWAMHNC